MSEPTPGPAVILHPRPTVLAVMRERVALACAVFSGLGIFLGFAGKEIYPLAFVSLTPLLVALRGRTGWRALRLGWITGFVAVAGGFSWIVGMLQTFSGFPTALCVLFASLLWIAQGLQYGVLAWLVSKADGRHLPRLLAVPLLAAAVELLFPLLFPWYLANSLHNAPLLYQTADLGGVLLITAAMVLGHTALAEAWVRSGSWAERLKPLAWPLAFWALAIPYGHWRIGQVDADNVHARSLRVGVVQQNLGLMQKRHDPVEALNRHLEASRVLEQQGIEWIVWSESAVAFRIPENVTNIRDYIPEWDLHTPVLFGALSVRNGTLDRPNLYNTAFMTDAEGRIRGSYDKVYLLAFGEYIPLGETFPQIYDLSPHSGHFTRGSTLRSLPVPGGTVAPFICYEDILPRFVRTFQNRVNPDLMAVILNDAWFGHTAEPWIHNALSKFRAVEHRRDLVRAANSGVSSIIDGAGRVVAESQTFTRENVVGTVHLRQGRTLYGHTGDWVGYAGVLLALYSVVRRRTPIKAG